MILIFQVLKGDELATYDDVIITRLQGERESSVPLTFGGYSIDDADDADAGYSPHTKLSTVSKICLHSEEKHTVTKKMMQACLKHVYSCLPKYHYTSRNGF